MFALKMVTGESAAIARVGGSCEREPECKGKTAIGYCLHQT